MSLDTTSNIKIEIIPVATVWDLRYEVMYPEFSLDFVKLEKDLEGLHLGLKVNDEVVSVLSVFYEGEKAQFRKFCTKVIYQRQGYGSTLLTHFFEQTKLEKQYRMIWCNARVQAAGFYQKFGMNLTDHTYSKNGYDYVVMECAI